jgi:Conjugative transposon protein TcpC
VAGGVRLDDRHALITVAATLSAPEQERRLLTVPVARDAGRGLVVYDLPSFAPAPGRATVAAPEGEPVLGSEREAISEVLVPFLRAYLAGDSKGLAYLVPAGTQITAAAGRWELIDLTSLSGLGPATDAGRVVLATVQARDERLSITYSLRYRVRLVRRDRWYVAGVNDGQGRR